MNDVARSQISTGSSDSMSSWERRVRLPILFAGVEDRGASSAVDGAVDTTTAHQRGVRGIDDSVGVLAGDVADEEEKGAIGDDELGSIGRLWSLRDSDCLLTYSPLPRWANECRRSAALASRDMGQYRSSEYPAPQKEREPLFDFSRRFSHYFLSDSASTPGSFFPSRNSNDAPPPVDICVILSATPAM